MQFLFFFLTVRSDLFRGRSPTTEALVRAVQFEMSVDQLGSNTRGAIIQDHLPSRVDYLKLCDRTTY